MVLLGLILYCTYPVLLPHAEPPFTNVIIMVNMQLPPPCIRDLSDVEQPTSEANQMLPSETATLNAKVQEECKGFKPELLRSFMIARQALSVHAQLPSSTIGIRAYDGD